MLLEAYEALENDSQKDKVVVTFASKEDEDVRIFFFYVFAEEDLNKAATPVR